MGTVWVRLFNTAPLTTNTVPAQGLGTYCCIVSPQLWSGISCIQTGSLTLENDVTQYMWHSPLWSTASLLSSVTICFHLSWPPAGHIIGSFPQAWLSSTHLTTSAWYVVPTIVERRCGMRWKEDNGELREDKVPLGGNRGVTCGKLYLRRSFSSV